MALNPTHPTAQTLAGTSSSTLKSPGAAVPGAFGMYGKGTASTLQQALARTPLQAIQNPDGSVSIVATVNGSQVVVWSGSPGDVQRYTEGGRIVYSIAGGAISLHTGDQGNWWHLSSNSTGANATLAASANSGFAGGQSDGNVMVFPQYIGKTAAQATAHLGSGGGVGGGGAAGGGGGGALGQSATMPWLPADLASVFDRAWAETGDFNLALAAMRESDLYDRYFAGNRRDDGSLRFTEQQYLAEKDGFRQSISEWGLDPRPFERFFVNMIEGDKSLAEFRDNLSTLWSGVVQNTDAVQQFYLDNYGVSVSREDIMANAPTVMAGLMTQAVDPQMSQQILSRQIRVSQIGGEAASFGFQRPVASVGQLADLGVSQEQARQGYSQAAQQTPTLSAFAARYFDPDDSFGVDDFEQAIFALDPEQQERARRLIASERSAFSTQGGLALSRSGEATGLRQG